VVGGDREERLRLGTCCLIDRCPRFGRTLYLHLEDRCSSFAETSVAMYQTGKLQTGASAGNSLLDNTASQPPL
jgi:hypothetical protein